MTGNGWWGFMAFDDCADEQSWPEIEQEALRAASGLFGSAIAARAGREALRVSLETVGSILEKLKGQSAEIERQNVELTRANRMKSEFLAAITHELKTPLNAILGFADLLDAGLAGELARQQREYVGDILGAARQLHELVNRLLDLAQIDAGKKPFIPEETDLGALLHDAAAAQAAAAQARGIAVTVAADEVMASVDARLLRQLLDELIGNAIKFNRDGGTVTLRAGVSPSPQPRSAPHGRLDTADRLRGPEAVLPEVPARPVKGEGAKPPLPPRGGGAGGEGAEGGEQVIIEVADSGIGIAAADQAHLFEPFIQIDATLGRKYGGTGLGLVLARRIAEMHGGSIAVDSAPGQGSRFTVQLPRRLANISE
ncbi:MAG: HAMP domain-containing histidine kinase [Gallionella sp.]|nr:HAMP domain-containing histidine kinase [Gallionella sp.]